MGTCLPVSDDCGGIHPFEIANCDLKARARRSTNQSVRFHRRGRGDVLLRALMEPPAKARRRIEY